jgi:hypothetical protein
MPDPDPRPEPYAWTSSPENDKVIGAFVQALTTLNDVRVDSKVEAGPMRYKYATLGAVLEEIRPKLATQGLVLSQSPTDIGVITTVFHSSGQWLRFPPLLIRPAGGTPQNMGSAISYARRYQLLSICNLATDDDDGAAASTPPPSRPAPPPEPDPRHARIAKVTEELAALSEQHKTETKNWAAGAGKKLSPAAMFEDPEWLGEVEGYLAMLAAETVSQSGGEEPF